MLNWVCIPGKILSAPLHQLNVETNGIHRRTQADWQTDGYLKPSAPFGVIELLKGFVLSLSKCISSDWAQFQKILHSYVLHVLRGIPSRLVWMQFFNKFYNFWRATLLQLFPKHPSWSVWVSKHWSIDAIQLPSALPPFSFTESCGRTRVYSEPLTTKWRSPVGCRQGNFTMRCSRSVTVFKQNIIDIRPTKIEVCLQCPTEWDLWQMSEAGYVQKF